LATLGIRFALGARPSAMVEVPTSAGRLACSATRVVGARSPLRRDDAQRSEGSGRVSALGRLSGSRLHHAEPQAKRDAAVCRASCRKTPDQSFLGKLIMQFFKPREFVAQVAAGLGRPAPQRKRPSPAIEPESELIKTPDEFHCWFLRARTTFRYWRQERSSELISTPKRGDTTEVDLVGVASKPHIAPDCLNRDSRAVLTQPSTPFSTGNALSLTTQKPPAFDCLCDTRFAQISSACNRRAGFDMAYIDRLGQIESTCWINPTHTHPPFRAMPCGQDCMRAVCVSYDSRAEDGAEKDQST